MAEIIPELYVVGAGPGDPELLTMQAHKILQTAAVILYDNLANQELLALAPAELLSSAGVAPRVNLTP